MQFLSNFFLLSDRGSIGISEQDDVWVCVVMCEWGSLCMCEQSNELKPALRCF